MDEAGTRNLLLDALPEEAVRALMARAVPRRYGAGSTIFAQGDAGETMLVIEAGRVEISLMSPAGRRSVLDHMGPGEVVGEIALLDRNPRSADVVAATDVSGRSVHRGDLLAVLQSHPESALHLLAELCAKVRNASDMFAVQSETRAAVRLARCVLRLAAKWGTARADGTLLIPGSFSQADLGALSGLARENVNRTLRVWTAEGVVRLGPEGLELYRHDALEDLAEE
jgi:CRP-like cAMP-binding protein